MEPTVPAPITPSTPRSKLILVIILLVIILLSISLLLVLKLYARSQTKNITQTVTPTPTSYQSHIARQGELRKLPWTDSITLPCPSVPEFCQNPKGVLNEEGGGVAIGNNIKAGSPIYAVFDGQSKLRTAIVNEEQFFEIDLISSQNNSLRAYYFLKSPVGDQGSFSIKDRFNKGEVITTVSAEAIKYLGNYNLVFKLFDNDRVITPGKVIFE